MIYSKCKGGHSTRTTDKGILVCTRCGLAVGVAKKEPGKKPIKPKRKVEP